MSIHIHAHALARKISSCTNPNCSRTVERQPTGRQKRFCSEACRKSAARGRVSCPETIDQAGIAESTGEADFRTKLSNDLNGLQGRKTDLQKASLYWIKVNSVTHKLTDSVMERTPASHGQWAGFNIERGLGWAIEVGWPFEKVAWYAHCGDNSYGPTDFNTAKRAAMAFAKGAKSFPESGIASSFTGPINLHADPEVAVSSPVHLNGSGLVAAPS